MNLYSLIGNKRNKWNRIEKRREGEEAFFSFYLKNRENGIINSNVFVDWKDYF